MFTMRMGRGWRPLPVAVDQRLSRKRMEYCQSLRCKLLVAAALVLGATSLLNAQATSGSIFGTVTDPSGGVVPGVTVTVLSIGQGIVYKARTNDSGNYEQTHLENGLYEVDFEAPGFQKVAQSNVSVSNDQATRLDAKLQVGAVSQTVEVSSAPPPLVTDRAEVSSTLTAAQVRTLPTLDRNITRIQLLLPGAQYHVFQHASSENPQGGLQINNNGIDFGTTSFLIDGTEDMNNVLGIINVNPTEDSVQEYKYSTADFDAEFSEVGGAVIQVTTKSGTNHLHGSLFEYLQNSGLNARNPFSEPNGPPPLRWNQFGGSAGGPIKKDKVFFFGDYQGTRRRTGGSLLTTVPSAAERNGDFSGVAVPIYDPSTGNPDGTGRTQFGSNMIPTNRISPAAANLLALLPTPNNGAPGAANNNYIASGSEVFDTDQFDVRVDHNISSKLSYFSRYSFADYRKTDPPAFGALAGGPGLSGLLFGGQSKARMQNLVGGADYVFSPTLLTDFRFGYSRYRVHTSPLDSTATPAQAAGIPGVNLPNNPDTGGMPGFVVPGNAGFNFGYALAINQCTCPLNERYFMYQGVDNWTKILSNHTIKWGADIRWAGNLRLPNDSPRGTFTFSQSVTAASGVTGSGLGAASFLLGLPSSFTRVGTLVTDAEDRQTSMFYFAQDTWRATRKLTLTYGLRWDTWFPDTTLHAGQGSRYDVTTNNLILAGVGGNSKSANVNTRWHNLSPRFGIAYQLNSKTAIRSGWGRSYFQEIFGFTFNDIADGYPTTVLQSPSPATIYTPVFTLAQGPPAVVFPQIPSNGLLQLPNAVAANYIPANQPYPYVDSWNLSVERLLARETTFTASYVGNVGRDRRPGVLGPRGVALNLAVPGPGSLTSREALFNKFGITQGINDFTDGMSSSYEALQTKFNKRLSGGLSLFASYTYSKSMDYQYGLWDGFNNLLNHADADFDRTHVFTIGHTWQLPVGRGRRFLSSASRAEDLALGGWEFSGITNFETGWPFSPTLSNTSSLNSNAPYLRPNVVPGASPYTVTGGQNRNQWFNPVAFAVPGAFVFGNAGRNSLRGPNFSTADWSLEKRFAITESKSLSFRWDAFNILNRTNLANPNTNVDAGANAVGRITGLIIGGTMRRMQIGLHLDF